MFPDICDELNIVKKVTVLLEEEEYVCPLPCLSQCTHLKTILLPTIASEFVKAWCTFMNKIIYRKIEINSNNYMYELAKRMSNKYIKTSEGKVARKIKQET